MTELSQKILDNYQVRKTKKQKMNFITLLKSYFPELQIQQGGFPKNRNLILGDVNQASVVLTAHYDTCAMLPFPNLIMPKNILLSILYSILIAIPFLALGLLLDYAILSLTGNMLISYIVSIIFYFFILYMAFAGPANRHTANDNTSGVITLCEIYQAMSPAQRAKAAIVFFDNEELGLVGSAFFRSKYKKAMKNKLLINFDCVSDGDHIMIAVSKRARPQYLDLFQKSYTSTEVKNTMIEKAEKLMYPSDQANFKCTAAVAALNKKKLIGYYMNKIHTARDKVFDVKNIEYLKTATVQFVDQL